MLKRADIANECTITQRGTIANPGKFENTHWWIVALWDATMDGLEDLTTDDGDEDDDGSLTSWFHVSEAMVNGTDCDMPRGLLGMWIALWEDDNGFVHHVIRDNAPEEF